MQKCLASGCLYHFTDKKVYLNNVCNHDAATITVKENIVMNLAHVSTDPQKTSIVMRNEMVQAYKDVYKGSIHDQSQVQEVEYLSISQFIHFTLRITIFVDFGLKRARNINHIFLHFSTKQLSVFCV